MAREPKDALFHAITRGRSISQGLPTDGHDLARILVESLNGSTKEAAKRLGVSQRTVQRWLAPAGRERRNPRSDSVERLRRVAARTPAVRNHVEVRRRLLAARRQARLASNKVRVRVRGVQGPVVKGVDYRRWRHIEFVLPGQGLSDVFDLWLAGADANALGALEALTEVYYGVPGWQFGALEVLELGND
jgi:predicted transcriptional regulator